MKLSRMTRGIALTDHVGQDVEITSLTCDTRDLVPGGLFAALKGSRTDGNRFIQEALHKGAAAILCQEPPAFPGPWLVAQDVREAYGLLCANWFGRPGENMTLVGVTGTNGKTTTTYLIKHVLERVLDAKVGLIGTNQTMIGDQVLPAKRTTPDPYVLQCLLGQMKRAGCTHVVMEVSSHALVQRRTAGLDFACGIFTNLTRDHLDYHGTMEAYYQAKALLFDQCQAGFFNLDDPAGRTLAQSAPCRRHTFGQTRNEAQVLGKNVRLTPQGVEFEALVQAKLCHISLPIPGSFSVYNALGVISCCLYLGCPLHDVADALATVPGVKGRAEVVPVPAPYTVIIDYAHTPDGLQNVLQAVQGFCKGRVIAVFGCGGDRDPMKRPIMGEIGVKLSDFAVITSDNPRTEDPMAIIEDILKGVKKEHGEYIVMEDRRAAIRYAMDIAKKDDIIVLAGKGHETYQDIGGQKHHLDEREEVAAHLEELRNQNG